MDYIEAPNSYDSVPRPLVFLAGGITGCTDWQQAIRDMLEPRSITGTLLNPRRANFPIHDPAAAREQIMWEYHALWTAEIISFWFCQEGLQPIVMFEFGVHMMRFARCEDKFADLIVGIEPGFPREQDIRIQAELAIGSPLEVVNALEGLASVIENTVAAWD